MFKVIKTEGRARRGEFQCAHGGVVQTPVFMNVGTQAAIKGGVSAFDLQELGCQIELSNTYHLHLRPGDDVVALSWAAGTASCKLGWARFSRTRAGFRCSRSRGCARSPRRA